MQGHDAIATRLAAAHRDGEPADVAGPGSIAAGYAVQASLVDRLADRAGEPVGYKLGFTNEAVRRELGVAEPVFGRLLADTVRSPEPAGEASRSNDHRPTVEASLPAEAFVDPRVEPEIVVRVDRPLDEPTREAAAAAVGGIAPAIELVDSRTGRWELSAEVAVADNALAAGLVVGPARPLAAIEPLADLSVEIRAGRDRVTRTGEGSAVMGDPLQAVAWLAEAVDGLPADTLVSTGSLTETLSFDRPIRAAFDAVGTVAVRPE